MLEEPPLIQIRTDAHKLRPSAAQIAAFRDVPTGNICDALGGTGALDMAIKPLPGCPAQFCGPALTVDCGPADILALVAALPEIAAGDVVLQTVAGHQGCAAIGDLVSGMVKNCGAVAVVTDGPARDLAAITALDFPVFATGINPNSPFGKGPGRIGHPIIIGGRHVETGDIVKGDRDGVVTIPFARIDATIAALADVTRAEAAKEAEVKAGLKWDKAIDDLHASGQVRRAP